LTEAPKKIKILVKLLDRGRLPIKATAGSVGFDVESTQRIELRANERRVVPIGVCVKLPEGYELQVRPRSGNALKLGLTVLNSPGTIDSDYTGEIGVLLHNTGSTGVTLVSGSKIAQLVPNEVPDIEWEIVSELPETTRGSNGYGSTDENMG